MRYTDDNRRDVTSEIEFLDECGGCLNEDARSDDSSEKEQLKKKRPKASRPTNTDDESSSDYYFVKFKLSKQIRRRIKIFSDLEQISSGEFYVDAIYEKLDSLARKYGDMKELKSILTGK